MTTLLRQSEYRKDPLSDAWVVVAAERNGRPDEFAVTPTQRIGGPCPFCAGNEVATPIEISRYPQDSRLGDWKVRVVPNKFPAVVRIPDVNLSSLRQSFKNGSPTLFSSARGDGGHEVIIESPNHTVSLTDLDDDATRYTFLAYRDRMRSFAAENHWAYVQVFKNVGAGAGSSIEHAHSQVVGLPAVPVRVAEELAHTAAFLKMRGKQLFAAMIEEEMDSGERVVAYDDDFLAICPYASRFPYEVTILPRVAAAQFECCEDRQVENLGRFTKDIIRRLERALNRPAYNYLIHSAPFDNSANDHYHWHIEILPRVTKLAGFEWGTGYYINPVSPEQAAEALRSA